jgi:hypothetical protein
MLAKILKIVPDDDADPVDHEAFVSFAHFTFTSFPANCEAVYTPAIPNPNTNKHSHYYMDGY